MKSKRDLCYLFVAVLVTALVSATVKKCTAGEFYLAGGLGKVGYRDLVDRENASVHDDPIGRVRFGYRDRISKHWSVNAEAAHMSSVPADDGGNNWAGIELEVRW